MTSIEGAIGLAMRAGCVCFGYQAVADAVTAGKVKLVLLAQTLAPNTRKKITACCESGKTPYITAALDDFGPAIGKVNKLIIGITSDNFKKLVLSSQVSAEVL